MKIKLVEEVDYYWSKIGDTKYRVFTETYLAKRGFCCKNNCRHCPYKKKTR